jgi:hypothetical protein
LAALAPLVLLLCVLQTGAAVEQAQSSDSDAKPLPTIEAKTDRCSRHEGPLTIHLDPDRAKVYVELPAPAGPDREVARFIYVEGLRTGIGSNHVGLDRGQLGDSRLVVFRRIGRRLLVEQPNLSYRALSDSAAERAAVRESFATSILWAGDIVAQDSDGRSLVDFTPFVVRDAHRVVSTLKLAGQGDFKLDKDRSVLDPDACLVFPDNIELEALLTFDGGEPGPEVRSTAPTGEAVTLIQHHSLLRLPDDGYTPRRFDPRAPSFPVHFVDYAAPLSTSLDVRWIARHRLEKVDPAADKSKVKESIIYYVERGAPEPIRSALVEGAGWWAKAFEAAGFVDAFRVELLPENAHPLDARYHVIQWVHRATRGWSYGNAITDPRTGEIIKGHVSLGSLRVRQDRLLFEGLAGTEHSGTGRADDPIQLALARIRQLSAHEVGHTLGFTHNFAASTYAGRASVMDYPAPLVRVDDDGNLDFSDAYGVGVGAWDRFAVRYAYTQFPPGTDEGEALDTMITDALGSGLPFLSDDDARPAGAAHPLANLWDNGSDPVAELGRTLEVRRVALSDFGERNIQPGMPLSLLNEVLVPVYLYHRYQVDAAVKGLGGVHYRYAVRGDGQPMATPIDTFKQTTALDALLDCIAPEELDLPESVLARLLPRPYGYGGNRELFDSNTGPTFDALGAAASAADLVLGAILQPERCARLVDHHRRDPRQPSLAAVLDTVVSEVFAGKPEPTERRAELRRTVQRVLVARFIQLASQTGTPQAVVAEFDDALREIRTRLVSQAPQPSGEQAHIRYLSAAIDRYLNRPLTSTPPPTGPQAPPPGSPIGAAPPGLARCSLDPS